MNKLRYNVSFWLGALFLFVTGGCSDYFDVRPKSQVLADELFSTEEGFSDQLTGVYKRLASTSLYGQDWRHTYHWTYSGSDPYLSKFWQYENGTYKNFMPVLRWSEMYYIAAEASLNTDSRQAVRYLNTVRNNRYLDFDPLDENLPVTQIQNEIYKEYRKELVGEGQLFYYYKRLNFASIPGSAVSGSDDIYVLPMPENEVEFGNRQ